MEEEERGCCIVAPAATAPSQYIWARPQPRFCLYRDESRSRCRRRGATGRPQRDAAGRDTLHGTLPGRSAGADENISPPLPVARYAQEVLICYDYLVYYLKVKCKRYFSVQLDIFEK